MRRGVWLPRLLNAALWITAILALSRSIAATGVFFADPTAANWVAAIGFPLLFIASFFGLSLFEYARLRRRGRIRHPSRLYERLTGGSWPPDQSSTGTSSGEVQDEEEDR
jgi:hypothetical protein